jgi:predicted acyltransferase
VAFLTRLTSLDAFRGFTIAAMVLVNNPGDWNNAFGPLLHAQWHGWTFTDTVFPFFLFIVGVSMTLSTQRQRIDGITNRHILYGAWWRALLIFLIGLAMNFIPQFDLSTVRIPGVLQRIALCTFIAAPFVVWFGVVGQGIAMAVLFGLYMLLMLGVPVPDVDGVVAAGRLEAGRDFGAYMDRMLLSGHLWAKVKTWDPEGLVSTLPAVGNVLAGCIAGQYLRRRQAAGESTRFMLGSVWVGAVALFIGDIMNQNFMPINKNLWTVSYSLWMTGWAVWAFAAFFYFLDAIRNETLRNRARQIMLPFSIYGMNALFIFVLSGLIGRLIATIKISDGQTLKAWLYLPFQALGFDPKISSLLFAICFNLMMFAVAWALWKRRIFIKV